MGFIFDLDGTLLNSINDLGNAMNRVLENNEFPVHNMDAYRMFVGNGMRKLVERSLPDSITDIEPYYEEYLEAYGAAYYKDSYLYEGVVETLKILNDLRIPIAIHTNKMQVYTENIVNHYLSEIDFVCVVGDQVDGKHKPNPYHTQKIVNALGCDTVFFVGDSDVDMKTAQNAHLIPVGVSWGFRSVEELKREGAVHVLDAFSDVLNLIKEC